MFVALNVGVDVGLETTQPYTPSMCALNPSKSRTTRQNNKESIFERTTKQIDYQTPPSDPSRTWVYCLSRANVDKEPSFEWIKPLTGKPSRAKGMVVTVSVDFVISATFNIRTTFNVTVKLRCACVS